MDSSGYPELGNVRNPGSVLVFHASAVKTSLCPCMCVKTDCALNIATWNY